MIFRLGTLFLLLSAAILIRVNGQDLVDLFAQGSSRFAGSLYTAVIRNRVHENIVISPFSVQICGALIYSGAAGETAEEMAHGLKLFQNNRSAIGTTFHLAIESHNRESLIIANKMYLGKDTKVKPEFQEIIRNKFLSEEENVDFSNSEQTAEIINNWVKSRTRNKIRDIFNANDFDVTVFMALINTLYFKGDWVIPFEGVRRAPFWISANVSKEKDLMFRSDEDMRFAKIDELDAKVVQLDYKNTDIAMLVILPNERTGLKHLEAKLSRFDLVNLPKKLNDNYVSIFLPKFKIEFSIDLEEPLTKLGMGSLFKEPDFSNMIGDRKAKISKAIHKAFIEVTEVGTEAGAAAGFAAHDLSISETFNADHPFFFAIVSKSAVLFAGRYVN